MSIREDRVGLISTTDALPELQAAVAAGFTRWIHFRIARRAKLFPEPAKELAGVGPVWTRQQIDDWLGITSASPRKSNPGEEEALRLARETSLRRKTGIGQR